MTGQAHVLYLTPAKRRHKTALVFIPGAGQTITNFLVDAGRHAPAGPKQFVDQGGRSISMDQPGRGALGLPTPTPMVPPIASRRTSWPNASPPRQDFAAVDGQPQRCASRPGCTTSGPERPASRGDPIFDQFYASQVSSAIRRGLLASCPSPTPASRCSTGSGSRRGHHPFAVRRVRLGDRRGAARPGQGHYRGSSSSGPPFFGALPPWGDSDPSKLHALGLRRPRPWPTISHRPIPPTWPEGAGSRAGTAPTSSAAGAQAEPARKLANLSRFPVMILMSSTPVPRRLRPLHRLLPDPGRREDRDLARMADHGLHGDGHMLMLEKHSAQAAALIETCRLEGRKLD